MAKIQKPRRPIPTGVIFAAVGILLVGVIFSGRMCNIEELSEPARRAAQRRCAEELPAAHCEQVIERHHDRCARLAYKSPKGSRPSFDDASYYRCLMREPRR